MEILVKNLKLLKKYGVTSVKHSFEDEGIMPDDVYLMKLITSKANINLNLKIGGCEAITDIIFANKIKVNAIIAPMIESKFSFQKFIESSKYFQSGGLFFNLESKNGLQNLDDILTSQNIKSLTGVVIGRSDLCKSYGHSKEYVDSNFIFKKVSNSLKKIKKFKLITKMGGSLTSNSEKFVQELFKLNLLDYIETRNVEIKLSKNNIKCLSSIIKDAILFESDVLKFKSKFYQNIAQDHLNRSKELVSRLSE